MQQTFNPIKLNNKIFFCCFSFFSFFSFLGKNIFKTYPIDPRASVVCDGLQIPKTSSNDRQQVIDPINQLRWVGWRVLSSKTLLNQPNRNLTKIRRFKLFWASFWSKYFRSNKIYAKFRDISSNLVRSQPDLVEISLDLARSHQIR